MWSLASLAAVAAIASSAVGAPVEKRQNMDVDILQFALTLEHLENNFYKAALGSLSEQMFADAGYDATYYSNLKYIAHDEESHVVALTAALSAAGAQPVAACEYALSIPDVKSFITLSSVLEGVGTSAYLGAAPLVTSKDYLTTAGSILVTEALHTSMQRAAAGVVPAANPYGTPMGGNEIYTLAAAFIKSCPASNAPLPFKAFPTLSSPQGMPAAPGIEYAFSTATAPPANSFVTFVSGLNVVSSPVTSVNGNSFMAMIPMVAQGQTYAVLTNANVTSLSDSAVIAGPSIIEVTPPSPTYDVSITK